MRIRDLLRELSSEFRAAQEADLPRRISILTPEAANNWIGVIDEALPLVASETPKRPCDYGPWRTALATLQAPDQPEATFTLRFVDADSGLINFASDASKPGWPDNHAHLVNFALRYLEADVMLFRSGYTKRHLLRRLKQANLDAMQTARIEALLRRAVSEGSGLEEYREYCRLSVRCLTGDLKDWLEKQADGALITIDERHREPWWYWFEIFGEDTLCKLGMRRFSGRHRFHFSPVPPYSIVKFDDLPEDNRVKLNAWRMLRHIELTGN